MEKLQCGRGKAWLAAKELLIECDKGGIGGWISSDEVSDAAVACCTYGVIFLNKNDFELSHEITIDCDADTGTIFAKFVWPLFSDSLLCSASER